MRFAVKMNVREYCSPEDSDARDEGGHFCSVAVPLSENGVRLLLRSERCKGCRNDFYNGRRNGPGRFWCWKLAQAGDGQGKAGCWHG